MSYVLYAFTLFHFQAFSFNFAVIRFEGNSCAAVPRLWLKDDSCYWPPKHMDVSRLSAASANPQLTWTLHKCTVLKLKGIYF